MALLPISRFLRLGACAAALCVFPAGLATAADYYVSASAGSNANTGLSPDTPWASLSKVNDVNLQPGDRVLLKGGDTFPGTLYLAPEDAGSPGQPVIVESYGAGRATIQGTASQHCILIYNAGDITLRNIDVAGPGAAASDPNSIIGIFLWCDAANGQRYAGNRIEDVSVSGFYRGIVVGAWDASFSGFADLVIKDCTVTDCLSEGITTYGRYPGTPTEQSHRNLQVLDCVVARCYGDPTFDPASEHSGSGIIMSGTIGGLIDGCIAHDNGGGAGDNSGGGPVGIWCWGCDSVTIQNCLVYNQKTTTGAGDGGGFDIDGGATDCVIQYCYSYNNEGPGYEAVAFTGGPPTINATIRYNVSWNDASAGPASLALWNGQSSASYLSNAVFHNNTIIARHAPGIYAGLGPAGFTAGIYNNVFISTTGVKLVDATYHSTSFTFKGNLYFDVSGSPRWTQGVATYESLEAWQSSRTPQETHAGKRVGVYGDPLLAGGYGGEAVTTVEALAEMSAFRPAPHSPAAGVGMDLSELGIDNGGRDFAGTPVSTGSRSIGAYAIRWNGREAGPDGWVPTGNFLGWVNVTFLPWVYQAEIEVWLYADEFYLSDDGGWVWTRDLPPGPDASGTAFSGYPVDDSTISTPLGDLFISLSPYLYSEAFGSWFYAASVPFATSGNWLYVFDGN